MNGEFQRHNSRLDDNVIGLHHSSDSDDSGGWWYSLTDRVWAYIALFLGMLILGVLFLTDNSLGE